MQWNTFAELLERSRSAVESIGVAEIGKVLDSVQAQADLPSYIIGNFVWPQVIGRLVQLEAKGREAAAQGDHREHLEAVTEILELIRDSAAFKRSCELQSDQLVGQSPELAELAGRIQGDTPP